VARLQRGLHGGIVHELGLEIAQGVFRPGDVIVPDEVGRRFEASRPTVREALRVLESKGMIRIRQSLGTRVTPTQDWNLLDGDVVYWRLHAPDRDDQLRELMQMRFAVEPVAARWAASRRDAEGVAALQAAWTAIDGAGSDVHSFTEADVAYHAALLRASGNQMFTRLTRLVAVALEAREEALTQHHEDVSSAAVQSHRAVVDAVQDGDGDRAETVMREMLLPLLDEPRIHEPVRTPA
jgi:DNA-binding FadR family transcriptional regulator